MDGDWLQRLHTELVESYDLNSFDRLLRFKLNKVRSHIVDDDGLNVVVFRIVETAHREGWLGDLLHAACEDRPKNGVLKVLLGELKESPFPQEARAFTRRSVISRASYLVIAATFSAFVVAVFLFGWFSSQEPNATILNYSTTIDYHVATIPEMTPLLVAPCNALENDVITRPESYGIPHYFQIQKNHDVDWIQVVDVTVRVHSYRPLPKTAYPAAAAPVSLFPHLIVVPLQPKAGTYHARTAFIPQLDDGKLRRPPDSHLRLDFDSLAAHAIEIRDDSPQPFIVVTNCLDSGLYDLSASIHIASQGTRREYPLGRRETVAFMGMKEIDDSMSNFGTLSQSDQEHLIRQLDKSREQRGRENSFDREFMVEWATKHAPIELSHESDAAPQPPP